MRVCVIDDQLVSLAVTTKRPIDEKCQSIPMLVIWIITCTHHLRISVSSNCRYEHGQSIGKCHSFTPGISINIIVSVLLFFSTLIWFMNLKVDSWMTGVSFLMWPKSTRVKSAHGRIFTRYQWDCKMCIWLEYSEYQYTFVSNKSL